MLDGALMLQITGLLFKAPMSDSPIEQTGPAQIAANSIHRFRLHDRVGDTGGSRRGTRRTGVINFEITADMQQSQQVE